MIKEKIILTDCDGVLVDWNPAFDNYMLSVGFPRLPNTGTDYNIHVRHGISSHQARECIKEFNESRRIADLKPFADSVDNVLTLANLGFRFIVITSVSDHPDAHEYRTLNLKDIFGDVFDEIHCLEMGANKAQALLAWEDTGYFWIEDHMRQAEAGHEAGLKPLLINHPYNHHYQTDLFPKVSYETPWAEIVDIVRKDYNI